MQSARVPQGIAPPNALTVNIVSRTPLKVAQPPPSTGLTVGTTTIGPDFDLSTPTGAALLVRKPDGSSVTWPATYTPAPVMAVSAATTASPIVVTVDSTDPLSEGPLSVTVAGLEGLSGASGQLWAQILSPTTLALYQDAARMLPTVGSGEYTSGGTVTPNARGTVVHDFEPPTSSAPQGDCDQIGPYLSVVSLTVAEGAVLTMPVIIDVVPAFALE